MTSDSTLPTLAAVLPTTQYLLHATLVNPELGARFSSGPRRSQKDI